MTGRNRDHGIRGRKANGETGGSFHEGRLGSNAGIALAPPIPGIPIPAWRQKEAEERIAKANRRLERAGIDERFEYRWSEPEVRTVEVEQGRTAKVEYRDLHLNHPRISYGGWEFVGSLDSVGDDDGMVARTRPGVELDGWRPDGQRCDHCGANRRRTLTYLVRNESGEVLQVGSSCVQDFLGVQPKGLWSLDYDPLAGLDRIEDGWGTVGAVPHEVEDTRMVIATALVASDMGRGFRPSSLMEATTKDAVSDALFGWGGSSEARQRRADVQEKAAALRDDQVVDEVLAAVNAMSSGSDYAENMKLLAGREYTHTRHLGYVVSAVSVWNKARTQKAQDQAPKASGYVAPPSTRIADLATPDGRKGLEVTVERVIEVEGFRTYRGAATDTILLMRTADGHSVKWKASNATFDLQPGSRLLLTGGSVKANEQYVGRDGSVTDQTVLTRVKFEDA